MKVFGLQFDKQNIQNSNRVQASVTKIFEDIARDLARVVSSSNIKLDGDKPFRIEDHPILKRPFEVRRDNFIRQLLEVVNNGTKKQWELANVKNDALVDFFRGNTKVPDKLLDKWNNHNMEALKVFQSRKTDGRNLSDRVWETAEALKGNMGMAIDIALSDGRSANELSRDVRQYLIEPEKLFRRVRDKHGGLHLSKEAEKFSPGAGVYRSSYKNAMRLARTEINSAYRTADNERIQKLDFVVGIEIRRSNRVFECDVCNSLVGKYPKDFVFTGWHPQCRCFVLSILSTKDEFVDQMKALLSGEEIEHKDAKELWKDFKSKEFDVSKKFKDTEDQKFITGKPILSVEIGNPNERGRVSIEVPVTMVVDGRNIKMNNSQGFLEGSFDKERKVFTVTKIDVNEELRNQGVARQLMEQAKGNLPKGYTIEMSGVFSDDGKKFNQSLIDSGFFNTSTKGIDSENTVYDTPPNFKKWVQDNSESIEASNKKGTSPFWMRDNINDVHRALNEEKIKRKAEEEKIRMAERRAERDKRREEERKREEENERRLQEQVDGLDKDNLRMLEDATRERLDELLDEYNDLKEQKDEYDADEYKEYKEEFEKEIKQQEALLKKIAEQLKIGTHKELDEKHILIEKEEYQRYSSLSKITKAEKEIVNSQVGGYIQSGHSWHVNKYHRTGTYKEKGEHLERILKLTETLDRVIEKNTIPVDMKLSRFLDYEIFVPHIDWDYITKSKHEMADIMNKLIGTEISDKGFMSCSANPKDNVFTHKPFRLEIKVKKGTNGFFADNPGESEVILGRGQKMKITGFRFGIGEEGITQTIVEVELVNK